MTDQSNYPPKPKLSPKMQQIADESNLEWALCGGISVGMYTTPYQWILAPKDRGDIQKEKTIAYVKLARAAHDMSNIRKIIKETGCVDDDDALKKIDDVAKKFLDFSKKTM